MEKKSGFQRKPDSNSTAQAFILKAFLIFFVLYLLKDFIFFVKDWLILFSPLAVFMFIWFKSIQSGDTVMSVISEYITFMPVAYTEDEWRGDRKIWATYILIFINIAIFYTILRLPPERQIAIYKTLMFLPMEAYFFNTIISPVTSLFLHGSTWHLWGNMLFLWVFGIVVERRIGWLRLLALYFATGIGSNILSALFHWIFMPSPLHGIGASGSISGIMGVFLVRMYFKKMAFPIPILGIFSLIIPINLKIRMNSMIVIGLYFVSDFSGGMRQIEGDISRIGHWIHVIGMLCGIGLALRLKLQDAAFEEMHMQRGLNSMEEQQIFVDGEESLRIVLERHPDNEAALLALAQKRSRPRPTEEGYNLYQRLIKILVKKDAERAIKVFKEYFQIYFAPLEASLSYRIAGILARKNDLHESAQLLEMIVEIDDIDPLIREKSLFQLALVYEGLKIIDGAQFRYHQFLEQYPASQYISIVRQKLQGFQ